MSNLIFYVAAFQNTDTYESCIKLQPGTNYTDTIFRDTAYTGQTPKYITVVNSCATAFVVPSQNIFTDTNNGGNFVASISSTNIPGNSTVNIPVAYNGTYKGANNNPVYNLSLNGSTATYTLTILTPDSPPVTQDNTINLANRTNTTVTSSNLIYSDPNSDPVTNVRFFGDVSKLYTDSGFTTQYVINTELPINFTLYFKAPDQDAAATYQVQYNVKANGVWSS